MDAEEVLVRLLDEGRLHDASSSRERERVLQHLAQEGASMVGTLLDLAERGSVVTVRTVGGRAHHGVLVGVGTDFCALRDAGGRFTYVRTAHVATVRPHPAERHAPASGDRRATLDLRLGEVLARAAPDRPRVLLVTAGEAVAGELRAAGADVVTIRPDGDPRLVCYVALAAVTEVVLDAG